VPNWKGDGLAMIGLRLLLVQIPERPVGRRVVPPHEVVEDVAADALGERAGVFAAHVQRAVPKDLHRVVPAHTEVRAHLFDDRVRHGALA
jgi:hypothetical protein